MDYNNNITFLVPTFNSEKTITEALSSLLNQSVPIKKILVLDNGSTDSTIEIVKGMSKENKTIQLILCRKPQNKPAALNQGLEILTSDFVGFLDSDDSLNRDFVLFHLNGFKLEPNSLISQLSYTTKKDNSITSYNLNYSYFNDKYEIIRLYTKGVINVVLWNKLFRSSVFKNFRFDESKIVDDSQSMYKLLYENSSIIINKSKLYTYNYNVNSLSNKPKSIDYVEQNVQISIETLMYFSGKDEYKLIYPRIMNRLFFDLLVLGSSKEGKRLFLSNYNKIKSNSKLDSKILLINQLSMLPNRLFVISFSILNFLFITIILNKIKKRNYK